jgi:hypothetical protein
MAEKVSITCPDCAKIFQVPAEILGRKIRCKNCGKAFIAEQTQDVGLTQTKPETKKKPEAKKKPADDAIIPFQDDEDEDDGKPYEVTSVDLAPRCPECANELESEDAVICLHCGFNLRTRVRAPTRQVKDVTAGNIFMWLLPGILAALTFFTGLGATIFMTVYWLLWDPMAAPEKPDRWQINCCNCCALWWCILWIWIMWKTGRFAIKRLIFNNKPPEEEV